MLETLPTVVCISNTDPEDSGSADDVEKLPDWPINLIDPISSLGDQYLLVSFILDFFIAIYAMPSD